MNIVAVVVTRDRPQLLAQALDALVGQTRPPSGIIVVDNASGMETQQLLATRSDVKVCRLEQNLGGAGGFAVGIETALAAGADWIWLMDDDAIARPNALAQLIDVAHDAQPRTGAVCSAVWEFGKLAPQHRRNFDPATLAEPSVPFSAYQTKFTGIDTASFVGFLLNAHAAVEVGLPLHEFFLAYDDTEYSLRLGKRGWKVLLAPGSIVDHMRSPLARLRHGPFGIKHYYTLRNQLAVFRHYGRARPWRLWLPMVRYAYVALRDHKISSLSLWRRSIRDSRHLTI
ncbi:glycosyl transferase [Mycetohabitans rhizoxinica HKI 454]|uniref:Glycosyl transferase n=2 Tax=Mycetohabitans rhizoxinica TaxID=412963 RepID=E5ATJ3_MYCRK|nr:glycosyltransferase [Mycetohabitans rhizoxinica]MCF7696439.1 glycosyltransferase [Mycetohabitans sp. B2]MCG1047773.1 glycosyltransferase [Mycetohabitans sp. B6]CBK52859.1 glycosyl transferase [Mycetohabitans rhizoxinica HKI 454]CBW75867.1 glycosyl transferase [Mycetohabitans rhizoxinica HKI 454]